MNKERLLTIIIGFFLASLLWSCDDDKENMEYASIYFPLATRTTDGRFVTNFDFSKDTTFIIGAYCAGSILPPQNINVSIELAEEEFEKAKLSNSNLASYQLLPADSYKVTPEDMKVVIKKGTERGDIKVTFHNTVLDPTQKYILPLKLASVSHYEISSDYGILFFSVETR